MSTRNIRATLCGAGRAGTEVIKCLHHRGVEIVGVLEINNIGKDAGLHAGIGQLGVVFENDAEAMVRRARADVSIITVGSTFASLFELARLNLTHGTNVITIAEDAYFPWSEADQEIAARLHDVALEHGVSFFATGMQDVFWQNCAVLFSSVIDRLQSIHLHSCSVLDTASQEILDSIHAGQSFAEFRAQSGSELKELSRGPLCSIAADLGLTVSKAGTRIEPLIARAEYRVQDSSLVIQAGEVLGTGEVTTVETAEGIVLVAEFLAKLREAGETDSFTLTLQGGVNLTVRVEDMQGFENTASIVVSRIPDVLNAPAGYITAKDLPRPAYRPSLRKAVS